MEVFEPTLFVTVCCMVAYFVAGFIDAIAGGGGLISIPALLVAGLPPHVALGTNKFATSLGSLFALGSFLRKGFVVMKLVPVGFASAFAGGLLGSGLAMLLDSSLLGKILIFLLPFAMLGSLFGGRGRNVEHDEPQGSHVLLKTAICGLLVGAYDGFFGPATGTFFIIALNVALGLGLVRCSATAKVLNVGSNLGSLALFASHGVVLYAIAIPAAVANIAGNLLGVHLAVTIGARAVRAFVFVALSLLGATLIYRYFLS